MLSLFQFLYFPQIYSSWTSCYEFLAENIIQPLKIQLVSFVTGSTFLQEKVKASLR